MTIFCKYFTSCLFFLPSINSFSQKPAIIIGCFEGARENSVVYIESNRGIKDSTHVNNNQFKFVVNTAKDWDVYFVNCPDVSKTYMFPLFINGGSQLTFNINKELNNPIIAGDKDAEEQNNFYQGFSSISQRYKLIQEQIHATKDSSKIIKLKYQLKINKAQVVSYPINWVINHKKSPFSAAIIQLCIATDPLYNKEDTLAERCFDLLTPEATGNNYQSYLLTRSFAKFNDKYSQIPINKLAPNFTVNDTSGNEIKLSDFKKEYLLIDFWASWCGPCRENNPLLKELYYKYKEKGLKVLSISVDTDASKWKAAIKKDKMDWLQGSDLSGEEYGVGLKYQIGAVPQYIFIAPDGTILIKSTQGGIELVESKLKSIFK